MTNQTVRVLVTDDEMGMRLGIARVLSNYTVSAPEIDGEIRFELEQAENGEQALDRIAQGGIDLLLLDHKMPGISGLDVLDRLATREDRPLTIMITAYASLDSAVAASKKGAYDFLAKPFTPDELKNTVRKAVMRIVLGRQARSVTRQSRQSRKKLADAVLRRWRATFGPMGTTGQADNCELFAPPPDNLNDLARNLPLQAARAFGRWIEALSVVARIDSGERLRRNERIDLPEVLRFALEANQRELLARKMKPTVEISDGIDLRGEAAEWDLAWAELLDELISLAPIGGELRCRASADATARTVQFDVDCQIASYDSESASRVLSHADNASSGSDDLLVDGLGWSFVSRWLRAHSGAIRLNQQPDRVGFRLEFPLPNDSNGSVGTEL